MFVLGDHQCGHQHPRETVGDNRDPQGYLCLGPVTNAEVLGDQYQDGHGGHPECNSDEQPAEQRIGSGRDEQVGERPRDHGARRDREENTGHQAPVRRDMGCVAPTPELGTH
ncbi:MAG: hypothetical protein PGN30_06835 [Mycolicibacterium neoaurum]